MKPAFAPYATAVKCLRIECTNGTTFRFTRYPYDLTMSNSQVYLAGDGFDFTGYISGSSMSPAAIDLEGTFKSGGITADLVASGVFDGARCYLFTTDFLNPVEDHEELVCSTLGRATIEDERYLIEEMALVDALNQPVGRLFMPACQKVFGGTEYAGCKKALGPLTVTGTITSAASGSSFADSARVEAAQYWTLGAIHFTTGANTGLKRMEIRSFSAGAFVTYEPFPHVPAIGDAYTLIPGCGKSRDECRDKWDNIDNFGGFPDMPPSSTYLSRGTK